MKKLMIIFCMFFFTATSTIKADVGNNVRYSSSSRGSSYSYRNRNSYGGFFGYGSYIFAPGGYSTIIILLIVAAVIYNSKQKNTNQDPYDPSTFQARRVKNSNLIQLVNDEEAILKIKEYDQYFDETTFLAYHNEVFVALQNAWTNKKWDKARQFESDNLFRTHKAQIEEFIRHNQTNYVEKIKIEKSVIVGYKQSLNYDVITVQSKVILRDYIKDDHSNKIIEGDPLEDIIMHYECEYIRKTGNFSKLDTHLSSTKCTNCGAENSIDEDGICGYCDTQRVNSWVLDGITSLQQL